MHAKTNGDAKSVQILCKFLFILVLTAGIPLIFTLKFVALHWYLYAFASTRMSMVLEPIIAQSFSLSEMFSLTMQQLMVHCPTSHQVMYYCKAVDV